jgi:hypothetical protein
MMTLLERFERKYIPEPNSGCFLWIGASKGKDYLPSLYGRMWYSKQRRYEYAHRISYELHRGEIPQGMHVLHRCDQPCCVNPDHLFLGTIADNTKDMVSKGRDRHNPLRGTKSPSAKLTDDMVREIRRSPGTLRQLGHRFGVSHRAILKIKSGKAWRHVE